MSSGGSITDFNTGSRGTCHEVHIEGMHLNVESSIAFPLGAAVRVEFGNRLWMGPVCCCEPAGDRFALEIEVEAALNDVANVEELAARFRHERSLNRHSGYTPAPQGTRRDIEKS